MPSQATQTKVETKKVETIRTFSYRNIINKKFNPARVDKTITSDFHLERAEGDSVKIVQDRNIDWVELANRDVDQVGLANILKLAAKGQIDITRCAFKDSEAADLSSLDPMNVNQIHESIQTQDANAKKLEAIASQLGVSVDKLVDSFLNGTFADLVSAATKTSEETKQEEGGKE